MTTYFLAATLDVGMQGRTIGLALAAGVAAFLVVGVAATEAVSGWIEFSVFVGIPVGLVAGAGAAAVVFLRLEDPDPGRRRPALAVAGFGAGFVLALVVAAGVLGLRNSVALPVAGVVGLLVGGGAVLRER